MVGTYLRATRRGADRLSFSLAHHAARTGRDVRGLRALHGCAMNRREFLAAAAVPAVANGARFTKSICSVIFPQGTPLAECFRRAKDAGFDANEILTPENVWNKFLLSPLEMRSFVDQFRSPWLQTHFDIGNVMQYGYPQDWILTLGSRIKRILVKDYKLSSRASQGGFVGLLEGDVDWKAVMEALVKVDDRGYLSADIGRDKSDPDQLQKVPL